MSHSLLSFSLLTLMISATLARSGEPLQVWVVEPHMKVFRDTLPGAKSKTISLRAARNEYEPGQFAVRSSARVRKLRIEVGPLQHSQGKGSIAAENLHWNFVGYIKLTRNTPESEAVRVRSAPCEVPDPLLENQTMDLAADTTQPVWITLFVPKNAEPGLYRGQVTVRADGARSVLPMELTVEPFTLPDERHLLVTNWFSPDNIARAHKVALWSEPFWQILERYAGNMARHRQNVVLVPWQLIEVTREADGRLTFAYGRFDRFVELFQQAGVGERIEIGHVGGRRSGWGSDFQLEGVSATERGTGRHLILNTEQGLLPLLSDLEKHLRQRNWLKQAMIHVADEPQLNDLASWKKISARVHQAAPHLRRIDAIESTDFQGSLEVWVPKLSHFDRWREAFETQRPNSELWYYICCHPYGNIYPNRFLDYPLSRVRVLHWLNFTEDLAGYLHWGWNFWRQDPFGPPAEDLPPGDTHVIYPGSDGPLNSIRWEIERDSLEDFEYLHLLTSRTAAVKARFGPAANGIDSRRRALELARRVVRRISDTEVDAEQILAVRRQIAFEIAELDRGPALLVQTKPAEGTALVEGPLAVEVRGITEPGTVIKVGGKTRPVQADGTFAFLVAEPQIRIEAVGKNGTKTVQRSFPVRRK